MTARSISREFREGLCGVNSASDLKNNKQASILNQDIYKTEGVPPPSTAATPHQKKLKNNIEFWEKMNLNR